MKLKANKINLTAKAVGLQLKTFDSGRNRSLNNDFNSVVLRKNFVQKDKSLGMALKTVPANTSSLEIESVDNKQKMSLTKVLESKKVKRASGQKVTTKYRFRTYPSIPNERVDWSRHYLAGTGDFDWSLGGLPEPIFGDDYQTDDTGDIGD